MAATCLCTKANCLSGSVDRHGARAAAGRSGQQQAASSQQGCRYTQSTQERTFDLKPLQPHSTSMPNTCERKVVSHDDFVPRTSITMPNVLQMLFSTVNFDFLLALTRESIGNLERQFFDGKRTTELDALSKYIQHASHRSLLVVFFTLLNIDQDLKQRIFTLDMPTNRRKILRFFHDLRQQAVPTFFSTEKMHPLEFVNVCEELYVIA